MNEDTENPSQPSLLSEPPKPPAPPVGSSEARTETRPSPDELRARREQRTETVRTLAAQLGEQERAALYVVVKAIGPEQALALLQETLQIEANGGMMLPDGSRRRTSGGVFFLLAKTHSSRARAALAQHNTASKTAAAGNGISGSAANQATNGTATKAAPQPPQPPAPAFRWEDRIAVLADIGNEKGAANVKMTVIGRPGKIVDKGTCVVTSVQSTKVPALPKGLPTPSSAATTYTVYIASKQWRKVAEAITSDPEDVLILEGFPQFDGKTGSIAVFVSNASTKKLQQAQKQAQKSETTA